METWLGAAVFALLAWAVQRLLSKVALTDLGTRKFYLLSAAVSLLVYLPYLVLRPPAIAELPPALGLACLMAVTFGVTTEAIRRGQLGTVSPITSLSPALSAALSLTILGERAAWPVYLGIALAPAGIVLLSLAPGPRTGERGWLGLALLSLVLQSVGAFLAKLVVAPAGPSALLLLSAGRPGGCRGVPGTAVEVEPARPARPVCGPHRHRVRDRRRRHDRLPARPDSRSGHSGRAPGGHQPRPRRAARRVAPERTGQPAASRSESGWHWWARCCLQAADNSEPVSAAGS